MGWLERVSSHRQYRLQGNRQESGQAHTLGCCLGVNFGRPGPPWEKLLPVQLGGGWSHPADSGCLWQVGWGLEGLGCLQDLVFVL